MSGLIWKIKFPESNRKKGSGSGKKGKREKNSKIPKYFALFVHFALFASKGFLIISFIWKICPDIRLNEE